MNSKSQRTLQRERGVLDIASMIGTLAGILLIFFSNAIFDLLDSRVVLAHFDWWLILARFFWWLGIAAWWIAIVLAITASLMNQGQEPRWRRRLRGTLIMSLSGLSIFLVFDAFAVITHQGILLWLGIIAIPVVLLSGRFILKRIMRRRMAAGGEEQQASR